MLYRKFSFDPHNFILKSFKIDKSFKHIVVNKKIFFIKEMKETDKIKFNTIKRFFFKKYNLRERKIKKFNPVINVKKKWYYNFWEKIKLNYLKKNRIKFKDTQFKHKLNFLMMRRRQVLKRRFYDITLEKRKQITTSSRVKHKIKRIKTLTQRVWLYVKKHQKIKKNWWLLRICLRKTAIYYGFKSLKKFRFINKFADSSMAIKSYHNDKLESMLNMFLLSINLFDNIFISNNFIKFSGFVNINFKPIYEPNRYLKVGQIVSFSNIRKVQNIFKKRCMFSKYFYLKKYKKGSIFLKTIMKILHNAPKYVHYDYQLMMFCIFRLQNKKEQNQCYNKLKNTWSIDTKLQYN